MTAVTLLGTLAISALASAGVESAVPTGSSSSTTGTFSLHTLKAADPSQSPSELEYSVYLAPGLRKGEASPLILYLHGGGGSAKQLEGIMHEYRLVRGANHIGNQFMALRTRDAMRFLGRAINPIDEHLEDNPFVSRTRERTKDLGRGVPLPAHR